MKLVDLLFSYLEEDEETNEDEEESLVDFDPNSKILGPREFLEKYTIEDLGNIEVSFFYELSEEQKSKEDFETTILSNNANNPIEAKINQSNVIDFLKKFKSKIRFFAKYLPKEKKTETDLGTPINFGVSFNWWAKKNPNNNYTLTCSVKTESQNEFKILGISKYIITSESSSDREALKVKNFIKKNTSYIDNSPINLLASIIIYNDWKYNWNVKYMQDELPKRIK